MNELLRHDLDFECAMKFIRKKLNKVNTLSSELLEILDFDNGNFFTLLTLGSNLGRLYEFDTGLVLPQNPEIEYEVDGKKSFYSETPTIEKELSQLLINKIISDKNLSCIFDDILVNPENMNLEEIRKKQGVYTYNREVLYIANSRNVDYPMMYNIITNSGMSFWHSLGVLSETSFDDVSNFHLSSAKIRQICLGTKMFMVGAYDGEGYIFWEKSNRTEFK